jgi:hypothetical protein
MFKINSIPSCKSHTLLRTLPKFIHRAVEWYRPSICSAFMPTSRNMKCLWFKGGWYEIHQFHSCAYHMIPTQNRFAEFLLVNNTIEIQATLFSDQETFHSSYFASYSKGLCLYPLNLETHLWSHWFCYPIKKFKSCWSLKQVLTICCVFHRLNGR